MTVPILVKFFTKYFHSISLIVSEGFENRLHFFLLYDIYLLTAVG
jgi:phosphate starvation-inducible membrane PsiE